MGKRIRYEIKETAVCIGEEIHTGYGISCLMEGAVVKEIEDLSTDRSSVETLAKACNELELDPIQLEDVAEDFVT